MSIKNPIEYDLHPKGVSPGMRWLTLRLKNIGQENLIGLDAKLNSLDAYDVYVYGTGSYVAVLKPGQEEVIPFHTMINETGEVYASLDGWQGAALFHWESAPMEVRVGEGHAQIVSLFALTTPYPQPGKQIQFEAVLQGAAQEQSLRLEFWAKTPSEEFVELGTVETDILSAQEQARYAAQITPQEEGMYTIYAYLYDGAKRIGHASEQVCVKGE